MTIGRLGSMLGVFLLAADLAWAQNAKFPEAEQPTPSAIVESDDHGRPSNESCLDTGLPILSFTPETQSATGAESFGAPGTDRVLLIPMLAAAPRAGEWLGVLNVEYDYFFLRNTSVNIHLQGFYFDQPGPNAWGLGPAMTVRHYFLVREKTNFFVAGGIGAIYSDHRVPEVVGSQWNLAPRAAIGFTAALTPTTRLVTGLRVAELDSLTSRDYSRTVLQAFLGLSIALK